MRPRGCGATPSKTFTFCTLSVYVDFRPPRCIDIHLLEQLQHRLRLETVRLLGARWLTPLTSAFRFDWHRRNSVNAARHICGEAGTLQFSWITPLTSIYWNNELIQDAEELRDHPEDDAVMHGLHPDDISDQQLLMDLMDD